jgi:hypothetical protein
MESHDDDLPHGLGQLRNEIAAELYAQLPLRDEAIEQEDVLGVAYALTVRLSRTFRFEWAPEWGDEPAPEEPWSLDAATFYGSALRSRPAVYPIFDWER